VERIFDIATVPFEQVGSEEKKWYDAKIKETGTLMGLQAFAILGRSTHRARATKLFA
jgi:hypothetical protein